MRDAQLFRCAHESTLPRDINVIATRGLQAKQEALGMLDRVGGGEARTTQEPDLVPLWTHHFAHPLLKECVFTVAEQLHIYSRTT
jgi:hypothetical protein